MRAANSVRTWRGRSMRVALAVILVSYLCMPTSAYALNPGDEGGAGPHEQAELAENAWEPPGDGQREDDSEADGNEMPDRADEANGSEDEPQPAESDDDEAGFPSEPAAQRPFADGDEASQDSQPHDAGERSPYDQDAAADAYASRAEDVAQQTGPVDLTAAWEAGEARVRSAGDYVLTAAVHASEPLAVELPAGAAATVDLAGFDVVVEGRAACAIDLSHNAGSITFTDSTYEARHESDDPADERAAAPTTSITLKAKGSRDSREEIETVNALYESEELSARALARFENVKLVAVGDLETNASGQQAVAAIRSGFLSQGDGAADARQGEANIELATCEIGIRVSLADGVSSPEALHDAPHANRERVSAIDARARGVSIDGYFAARWDGAQDQVEGDGRSNAGSTLDGTEPERAPWLSIRLDSAEEETYSFGDDVALSDDIVFGFPSRAGSDRANGGSAIVATAARDGGIPGRVARHMTAAEGYEAALIPADGTDDAYSSLRLTRSDTGVPSGVACSPLASGRDREALQEPSDITAYEPHSTSEGAMAAGELADSVLDGAQVHLSAQSSSVAFQATTTGTNLNSVWSNQAGGLSSDYTITRGGTYYLSEDLTSDAGLVVNAPSQAVVLAFNGHTLTAAGSDESSNGVRAQSMVAIQAASSVTFDGRSDTGSSSLSGAGTNAIWAVSSQATNCALKMGDLKIELSPRSNNLRNLHSHCVRLTSGSLEMERCDVRMDMSGQALMTTGIINCYEAPSAIYATNGVSSVTLSRCAVEGLGSSAISDSDAMDVAGVGNAYAVFSLSNKTTVEGGTYHAISLLGNATCLYGSNLEIISESVQLTAGAGQIATGVLSTDAASVHLGVPLAFSIDPEYDGMAAYACALRAQVENAFVFGPCATAASAGSYSMLLAKTDDMDAANADGHVIGSFASGTSDEAKGFVRNAVVDAKGPDGSSAVAFSDALKAKLVFRFDTSLAAAEIMGTRYPTIDAALDKLAENPSQTLTVLKDLGAVHVSNAVQGTIDLNGKAIGSLTYDASAKDAGLLVRNGTVKGGKTAVSHASPSPLELSGLTIVVNAVDADACGVSASKSAGPLTIGGSVIDVRASRMSSTRSFNARGIDVSAGGPVIALQTTTVVARALTGGVSAIAVRSQNAASVQECAISATGVRSSVYGISVGGSLAARSSDLNAYASDRADEVAAVKLSVAEPVATAVSIDSCSLRASSAVSDGVPCTCIAGATSDAGVVAPSGALSLAGAMSFTSSSDLHIGMNVGSIRLSDDFEVDASGSSQITVSQAKNTGAIGITVDEAMPGSKMDVLARAFKPKEGSFYDGWHLVSNESAHRLDWRSDSDMSNAGVVSVIHGGAASTYPTFEEALKAAQSGDTVKILETFEESGACEIDVNDLSLDLNGKAFTLRAGNQAVAKSDGTGAALRYSGTGTLSVANGELGIQVGASLEASAAEYQGIAVTGGGTVEIADSAAVHVAYTGGATSTAQMSIGLKGIAVARGTLLHHGTLNVEGTRADGGFGALNTWGVFVRPTGSNNAQATLSEHASVEVVNQTGCQVAEDPFYRGVGSAAQITPVGLREITIDPESDAGFYQDVLKQFRISASFDDPYDSSLRNNYSSRIYYVQGMTINHAGAWYDGITLWAYSDEVGEGDVGKLSKIVPSHTFVSASYDTLPEAIGVATGGDTTGKARLHVAGSIETECAHGNARDLDAQSSDNGNVVWECGNISLSAKADNVVHPVAYGDFDLRDYIAFTLTKQSGRVAYGSTSSSRVIRYRCAAARNAVVGNVASFALTGASRFSLSGSDAAAIQARSFTVNLGFELGSGSLKCTVASDSGSNEQGAIFARGAVAAQVACFEDAYGVRAPTYASGAISWGGSLGKTVSFNVGDAVVARFVNPQGPIALSGLTAKAVLGDTLLQNYELAGWSLNPDAYATKGYSAITSSVDPSTTVTYYAVYKPTLARIPVSFTGAFDSAGTRVADVSFQARYGETLARARSGDAEPSIPEAEDYTDDTSGVSYRFIGWSPTADSASSGLRIYDSKHVGSVSMTYAIDGASTAAGAVFRAVYLPQFENQHLVRFVVDDCVFAAVVDHGAYPRYTMANSADSGYSVPEKLIAETGKAYRFENWFVDDDGDGSLASSEKRYPSVLPKASADCAYTANWSTEWASATLSFYALYYDKNTRTLRSDVAHAVSASYAGSMQQAADSVATIGSKVGLGGKVYTLQGWSTRASDIEALFDAGNPLPSVTALSGSSAPSSFYGVYSTDDHRVNVTFYDGGNRLGSATVYATNSSIDDAFSKTGCAQPADRSDAESFLGWALAPNETEALDGASTRIEDIAGGTVTSVSLYAVYGNLPSYTVRLRSYDGKRVLYAISVKRGRTVHSVIKQLGLKIQVPARTGKYFSGWRTASKARYDFNNVVTGSVNLYASYKTIAVESHSTDIGAVVTSTSSKLEKAESVKFTIVKRDSADRPLRSKASSSSYSIMKSYDIRLVATEGSGEKNTVTGSFGTAKLTVAVDRNYKDSSVRGFWLGEKKGSETVKFTDKKTIGKEGTISMSIGDYMVGDADEGGNLSIGYIEGGNARNALASSTISTSPDSHGPRDTATRNPSSIGGDSARLGSSANGLGGSASGMSSMSNLGSSLGDGNDSPGEGDAGEEPERESWDSNAIALIACGLVLMALAVWGAWRLLVARQRDNESAVEAPSLAEVYAKGISF